MNQPNIIVSDVSVRATPFPHSVGGAGGGIPPHHKGRWVLGGGGAIVSKPQSLLGTDFGEPLKPCRPHVVQSLVGTLANCYPVVPT